MEDDKIKKALKEGYAEIARKEGPCCTPIDKCCGGGDLAHTISREVGYTEEEMLAKLLENGISRDVVVML